MRGGYSACLNLAPVRFRMSGFAGHHDGHTFVEPAWNPGHVGPPADPLIEFHVRPLVGDQRCGQPVVREAYRAGAEGSCPLATTPEARRTFCGDACDEVGRRGDVAMEVLDLGSPDPDMPLQVMPLFGAHGRFHVELGVAFIHPERIR